MSVFPYDDPVDPKSAEMDGQKLAAAVEAFRNQYKRGDFPGGQLVVRRYGDLVMNEVCGLGRGWREDEGRPPMRVKPDTPFPALSAGKPLAAVALAILEDRGLVRVETPVAEFIQGFARHGKGEITILDVLTHCSGISLPDLVGDMTIWNDRGAVLEQLIDAKPVYRRGTMMYAAYEYGWLLSELFWRITGNPLPAFIEEELSTPVDLPALKLGLAGRDANQIAWNYWLGKEKVIVSGVNVAENFEERNNSLQQINSLNPAVSLVTDAASLAGFYEFLVQGGITHTGERLISEETLLKYTTKNVFGLDRSSMFFSSLGRGFMMGARLVSTYGWWGTQGCFGHAGGFSSLAFGDHDTKIAVGIVTNGNRDFFDVIKRFPPLCQKLRRACQ